MTEGKVNTDLVPTSLDLVQITREERVLLAPRVTLALTHQQQFHAILQNYKLFTNTLISREGQLEQSVDQLKDHRGRLIRAMTASSAYKLIWSDITQRGGDDEDVLNLFRSCFKINSQAPLTLVNQAVRQRPDQLPNFLSSNREAVQTGISRVFKDIIQTTPGWFRSSEKDWAVFVAKHALFGYLTDSKNIRLWVTSEDARPEWMSQEGAITLDMVWQQFETDEAAEKLTVQKHNQIVDAQRGLHSREKDIFWEAAIAIEEQTRLIPPPSSFWELITFLKAAQGIVRHPGDLRNIIREKGKVIDILPEQAQDSTINDFLSNFTVRPSAELLALYWEDVLQKAEVARSAKAPLIDNTFGILSHTIAAGTPNTEAQEIFGMLGQHWSKEGHQILDQHLRILLALIPSYQLKDMVAFLETRKGQEVEQVIWKMAQALRGRLMEGSSSLLSPEIVREFDNIKSFSRNWLKKHYDWAFGQLQKEVEVEDEPLSTDTLIARQDRRIKENIKSLEEEITKNSP